MLITIGNGNKLIERNNIYFIKLTQRKGMPNYFYYILFVMKRVQFSCEENPKEKDLFQTDTHYSNNSKYKADQ